MIVSEGHPKTKKMLGVEKRPETADELYRAINSLGSPQASMSVKAYEEIVPFGLAPFKQEGQKIAYDGATRFTHKVYMIGSKKPASEAELVSYMWDQTRAVFRCHKEKPVIFWRRKPEFSLEPFYSENDLLNGLPSKGEASYLRMRLSIGSDDEQPDFKPYTEKAEGEKCVYLREFA